MIQKIFRKKQAWRKYKAVLLQHTTKHFDFNSGYYYYSWLDKVDWDPPKALKDVYIPYGLRRRTYSHVWTEDEAATVIQSLFRGRAERYRFVDVIKAGYEKVWEPSAGAYFYQVRTPDLSFRTNSPMFTNLLLQNKYTKECQWTRPFGLDESHEVDAVFAPGFDLH